MRYLLSVVLLSLTAVGPINPTHGGWGRSGCGQVVSAAAPGAGFTGWKIITPGVEQRYYRGGSLVGSWRERDGQWFSWREGRWVEAVPPWVEGCACGWSACRTGCACTEGRSCGDAACRCCVPNFGLDLAHLAAGNVPRYRVGGKPSAKRDVMAAIVDDDSAKPRLTIIGNQQDRAKVLSALPPEATNYLVKAYDPRDWAVARAGFKTDGHPTIYAQAPDGTVLHRQDAFADAHQLAEALRKADPSYDPAKDPDLTKILSLDVLKQLAAKVPPLGWLLAGLLVLYLRNRQRS